MSTVIACMRSISAETLIEHIWSVGLNFLEFPFVIVSRDRNFFKQYDAFTALRNGDFSRDVNLMIGINHDEGISCRIHFSIHILAGVRII
jgi:acetylcholinesterase/cholinesterase